MAQKAMMNGIAGYAIDTSINWNKHNPIIPSGVMVFESDNQKAKLGDGTSRYTELPYFFENDLSDDIYELFREVNTAEHLSVLDDEGKLKEENLYFVNYPTVLFVNDIDERDALDTSTLTNKLVIVINDVDNQGELSTAGYCFKDGNWTVIFLTSHINIPLDKFINVQTMDLSAVPDGGGYVKLTEAKDVHLDSVVEGATHTSNKHVMESGALVLWHEVDDDDDPCAIFIEN